MPTFSIPDNKTKPTQTLPVPPHMGPWDVETRLTWHYFNQEEMGHNESFVFKMPIAEEINSSWPCIWFYTVKLPEELYDPNCVILWGHDSNKSFTACDPNTICSNLGFEFVLTAETFFYRSAADPTQIIEVATNQTVGQYLVANLVDKGSIETAIRGYIGMGYLGGSGTGKFGIETNLNIIPDNNLVSGIADAIAIVGSMTNFTLGMGKMPVPRPGVHPENYWRPRVVAMGNDL